jgi:hypothetical protein
MRRDDLAKLVLVTIQREVEAARLRPRPEEWKWWELGDYEDGLELAPSTLPAGSGRSRRARGDGSACCDSSTRWPSTDRSPSRGPRPVGSSVSN